MIEEMWGYTTKSGTGGGGSDTLGPVKLATPPTKTGIALVVLVSLIVVRAPTAAARHPQPALLTGVELAAAGPDVSRIVLEFRGDIDRVETARLDGGRFVFDLTPVVWDGPTRRERPELGGIREYRYSQFSRDPEVARLVVEVADGWSCRHDLVPGGLVVACSGPASVGSAQPAARGSTIAVVGDVELASPLAGLDAAALIGRSLGYTPADVVHDGLPYFGSVRDDWMGAPRPHKGIDIYVDRVTVQAVAAGRVVGVGLGDRAGGWVKIDHGGGVESVYVHVAEPRVHTGDNVVRGQPIASIDGAVGNAVEPQLHFEVRLDGESVDPVPYIFALASDDLKGAITIAYQRLEALARERAARVGQVSRSD